MNTLHQLFFSFFAALLFLIQSPQCLSRPGTPEFIWKPLNRAEFIVSDTADISTQTNIDNAKLQSVQVSYLSSSGAKTQISAYYYFVKNPLTPSSRPTVFFYNGGPGASTIFLQHNFSPLAPPITWKGQSNKIHAFNHVDMVFIDMPGTGVNRVFQSDGNLPTDEKLCELRRHSIINSESETSSHQAYTKTKEEFYDVYGYDGFGARHDGKDASDFIKRFMDHFNTKDNNRRHYVYGESYGGIRNAYVASHFTQDQNYRIDGFWFTSGAIFNAFERGNDAPAVNAEILPSLCKGLSYHDKQNTKRCKGVQRFIRQDYPNCFFNNYLCNKDKFNRKMEQYTRLDKNNQDYFYDLTEYKLNSRGSTYKIGTGTSEREVVTDVYDMRFFRELNNTNPINNDFFIITQLYSDFVDDLKALRVIPQGSSYSIANLSDNMSSSFLIRMNTRGLAWDLRLNKPSEDTNDSTKNSVSTHLFNRYIVPRQEDNCDISSILDKILSNYWSGAHSGNSTYNNATNNAYEEDYSYSGDYSLEEAPLPCESIDSDIDCSAAKLVRILENSMDQNVKMGFAIGEFDLVTPQLQQEIMINQIEGRTDMYEVHLYPGGHAILPLQQSEMMKFEKDLLCFFGFDEICSGRPYISGFEITHSN